jgi:hypothetical protein
MFIIKGLLKWFGITLAVYITLYFVIWIFGDRIDFDLFKNPLYWFFVAYSVPKLITAAFGQDWLAGGIVIGIIMQLLLVVYALDAFRWFKRKFKGSGGQGQ